MNNNKVLEIFSFTNYNLQFMDFSVTGGKLKVLQWNFQ